MGLEAFGGEEEGVEERDGRQFVGAFDADGDVGDVFGEGEVDNGSFGVEERVGDEGSVGWSGEDSDGGDVAAEKEAC